MNLKISSDIKFSTKYKIGIWMVLAIIFYAQFDVLIHLLIEFLHASFELFEYTLDQLIEHTFHTELHTTQVITFYLMLLIAALILYQLARLIPAWYFTIKRNLFDCGRQLKEEFLSYWRSASIIDKMKWCSVLAACSALLLGLLS
jgi:hypothetical protein